ncbi:MAG: Pyruvoyl-dependent arginine decarboxylase [Candidatus Magnetoglobus multicellularis str. Araruama]|uniref:Pyruvoyl-dependent arginine decarboxylase AaxB n=1 Tax=Candidatus Magnetoglobus multicellularis str. Araruama TaxID=890399 RepID=A0A1V1P674_9BACT|nr:MAG: Pyruvoyl-dependent arginine decarboxylase [Candidatus Magnetoglobus multicellularis str. Araruama]
MNITICSGTGTGPNELTAFDTALLNAGIIDYNLIYLSSSIPAGSTIERKQFHALPDEIGHKLYVVIAKQIETVPGNSAWAGIGWTQEKARGRGLFVEHHGKSQLQVQNDIQTSLGFMKKNRQINYGDNNEMLIGIECVEQPVCAVVLAVFKSQRW